jgi:hypothetical protein
MNDTPLLTAALGDIGRTRHERNRQRYDQAPKIGLLTYAP